MSALADAAAAFTAAGCSVIPAAADGTKRPAVAWRQHMTERPAAGLVREQMDSGAWDGFGIVCGAVSGGLEMLEFEGRAITGGLLERFEELLDGYDDDLDLHALWQRARAGYTEETPSGGIHVLYRVTGGTPLGNKKLACRPATPAELAGKPSEKVKTLIETRGEGGYVITAPSAGRTHPTRRPWRILSGGPATIATITAAERDLLHQAAGVLDQTPETPPPSPPAMLPAGTAGGELRPGDDYAAKTAWHEILAPHGWTPVHATGNVTYWRRPGKDHGLSATTREDGGLYVFSTSTEFDTEIPHSKFFAYAMLNHGGDQGAAAAQLRRGGYGAPLEHDGTSGLISPRLASAGQAAETASGGQAAASSDGDRGDGEETLRHTWRRVDLSAVLDGTSRPPEPSVGARDDGRGLFYPGRMHVIAAETEAGKTWLALSAAADELRRGNAVVYLDFEDDEEGTAGRLMALGVSHEAIRDRFAYVRPEEALDWTGRADLEEMLLTLRPTLAVLDGITEAMSLHGLELKDNTDVAKFGRLLPRWIAGFGPAVVNLDHVTKDRDNRASGYALGGVHKLNGLNGAQFILESRAPFGIGLTGRSRLYVRKDRPGQLRRHGVRDRDGLFWYADLILRSHGEDFAEVSLEPAILPASGQDTAPPLPESIMKDICNVLTDGGAYSKAAIEGAVTGRAQTVRYALELLVERGYVAVEKQGSAQIHKLIRPYPDE